MLPLDQHLTVLNDIRKLLTRRQRVGTANIDQEPINEREFVRGFGAKVTRVRYSGRVDFVGLIVVGKHGGFWVTAADGKRRLRKIVIENGQFKVTPTMIELRNNDSVTNLKPGLLKWVW